MARFYHDYLAYAHYVCFDCRKSFAPSSRRDPKAFGVIAERTRQGPRKCPDCGRPLFELGLAFKPPRQRDRRTWKLLEAKARAGDQFLRH